MVDPHRPVLILGAGINGAAVARELLLNCVPVCVVDQADICAGATACSSRLIHGGLRYLEYGELDLVRESLAERSRLLRLAPQYVRPLRLYIPTSSRFSGLGRAIIQWLRLPPGRACARGFWLVQWGLWLYDLLARDSQLGTRDVHHLNDAGVPRISGRRYRWLSSYSDSQVMYPERFVMALFEDAQRLAAEHGVPFQLFPYHRANRDGHVITIVRNGGSNEPGETSQVITSIEPCAIINATGAWVDHTLQGLDVSSRRLMGGTKGSHLVTFHKPLADSLRGQGVYAEASDGRPVFILPLGQATLIGSTDIRFEFSPEEAVATEEEIEYLLDAVNTVLPDVQFTRDDVAFHYCGVRPLPYVQQCAPAGVTRRHWLEENSQLEVPLYSLIGGKLTTCRSLAEQTVATLLKRLDLPVRANTRDRVIPGGEDYPAVPAQQYAQLSLRFGLQEDQLVYLWGLFGTRVHAILEEISTSDSPSAEDWDSLDGTRLPRVVARWVIRNEWVTTLCDLVERRLMLLYAQPLSGNCLFELARLMVEQDLISADDVDAQVRICMERLTRHYGKQVT